MWVIADLSSARIAQCRQIAHATQTTTVWTGQYSIPLPRQWGYPLPPGVHPEQETKREARQENHNHRKKPEAILDPSLQVHGLNRHVVPLRLFVIAAASNSGPHNMLLVARHLECGVCKDVCDHDVLLQQVYEQHKPGML